MRQENKAMKRICLAIMLLLIFLPGCEQVPSTYQFPNRNEEIISIELLSNYVEKTEDGVKYHFVVLQKLDKKEIPEFMDRVYQLETARFYPPLRNYGKYIARITYANGDIELYGTSHIELVEAGSTMSALGIYYFPDNGMEQLILEFLGSSES